MWALGAVSLARSSHYPNSRASLSIAAMAAMASLAHPLVATLLASTPASVHSRPLALGSAQQSFDSRSWPTSLRPGGESVPRFSRLVVRAEEEGLGSAAAAAGDSVVGEVALLDEEPATEGVAGEGSKARKSSPLQKGGTLDGKKADGKDPSAATLGLTSPSAAVGEKFNDARWRAGTWDISQFTKDGKVNWDAVIDAEVVRRKWLEDNPEASSNNEPVVFETSTIPWWAWVKRFHLPEAELLNGRAAMLGYASAYLVDAATGVGLVDQTNSFFGKLLLFITVLGVLLIRKNSDAANLRNLAQESTFYDKQWQATWKDAKDPDKSDKP